MFEKFKLVPMTWANTIEIWGISRRKFLFFYKPLLFEKVILEPRAMPEEVANIISKERLTFSSVEKAEDEMDRLAFGEKPITQKIYLSGKLIRTEYDD